MEESEEKTEKKDNKTPLEKLFQDAHNGPGLNYIFTLLRVTGISNEVDPLWTLSETLKGKDPVSLDERMLVESFALIYNLIEQSQSRDYNPFPFLRFREKDGSDTKMNLRKIADFLSTVAEQCDHKELSLLIKNTFNEDNLKKIEDKNFSDSKEISAFLRELCKLYFLARLKFKNNELHKLPQFEVLELLTNKELGLYGFNMYFSNGNEANYERTKNKTFGINVLADHPVNFMVGMLSDLKKEWMVGEKRLYEVGLPGRYNVWGEWKPLIYPGDHQALLQESKKLSEEDDRVAGILFYIMCTGHRIIEFILKTPIEMPEKSLSLGKRMHLYKCDPIGENVAQDYIIYDGHYDLEKIDPQSIHSAIATINVGLNRMAFSYDSSIEWRIKYNIVQHNTSPKPMPTKEDLKVLNSMLVDFPEGDDAILLDICIDWFHRGEQAKRKNEFLAFLCYYIALEIVAIAVADGEADLVIKYQKETKTDKKN